jgi:hypothetical protein
MNSRTRYIEGDNSVDARPLLGGSDEPSAPALDTCHAASGPPGPAPTTPPLYPAYVSPDSAPPGFQLPQEDDKLGDSYKTVQQEPPLRAATRPPGVPELDTYRAADAVPVVGYPLLAHCPVCGHVGPPARSQEVGACAWLLSGALCLLGCWCCFCLPFCSDCSLDRVQRCSRCYAELRRSTALHP